MNKDEQYQKDLKALKEKKKAFENKLYQIWKNREDAYIEVQIRKNAKWHSFWKFLYFLLIGKD